MESYHGLILTPRDAMILLELLRVGLISKTTRRLSEFERSRLITNGAIFIWDEVESGMKRWTDGRSWSASRVSGSFLIYKEMENTKNFTFFNAQQQLQQQQQQYMLYQNGHNDFGSDPRNEDSYRYKNNGLIKQSFSLTLNNNMKLHLISYINQLYLKKSQPNRRSSNERPHYPGGENDQYLCRPSEDPRFASLKFDPSLYPELILNYQDTMPDFQQGSDSNSNSSNSGRSSSAPTKTSPSSAYERTSIPNNYRILSSVSGGSPMGGLLKSPRGYYPATASLASTPNSYLPPIPNSAAVSSSPSSVYYTAGVPRVLTDSPDYKQYNYIQLQLQILTPQYAPQIHQNTQAPDYQKQQRFPQFLYSLTGTSVPESHFRPPTQHSSSPLHQDPGMYASSALPSHHREDGRYLNMLDRSFSS